MKKDWKLITLGDACEKGSSNISQNQLNDEIGDFPIYGASGLIKNISFYHNDKPYLSIVKDGSGVGRVTKMEAFTSVIGTLQYIFPKVGIDLNYLYYSLISVDFKKYVAGAAIPHIYFKDYKNEPFLWMPLPEQQRIVSILDTCFAAIDKAKANAEQNLKNAKELFESKLQLLIENGIEKSDWEEKMLGDIADVEYGYTDKAKHEGDFRYIRITDINKDGLLSDDEKLYISSNSEAKKFVLQNNDLLMARTGATFAKVLLYEDREPSIFASYLIRIRFKEKIDSKFYWYYSKSPFYWEQAKSLSSGAAQPQFNGNALKQLVFYYPKSITIQNRIVTQLDELYSNSKKIQTIYENKLAFLDELKKSILSKLLTL